MQKVIQPRPLLVNADGTTNIQSGSVVGEFVVSGYSRITGLFSSNVGSFTLRYRMGPSTGVYLVTSSTVINSGNTVFDVVNYGRYTAFDVTACGSPQPATYYLQGDQRG